MHTISIAGERLLTTDSVADAVLHYATTLHRTGNADIIPIPVVLEDGRSETARLLISPTGAMLVLPDAAPEARLPAAPAVVEDLLRRIARLEPVALATDHADLPPELAFPDFGAIH